jgi:hypothetical protein
MLKVGQDRANPFVPGFAVYCTGGVPVVVVCDLDSHLFSNGRESLAYAVFVRFRSSISASNEVLVVSRIASVFSSTLATILAVDHAR